MNCDIQAMGAAIGAEKGERAPAFRLALVCGAMFFASTALSAPLLAQESTAPVSSPVSTPQSLGRIVEFSAERTVYDETAARYIASGAVLLKSEGKSVRADTISWNAEGNNIIAEGNIRFVDEEGNQLFTERLELTDAFDTGAMSELLIALRQGGRLAAKGGKKQEDGSFALENAAYSGCAVIDDEGCDATPSWRITAKNVTYLPEKKRILFDGATLELFGAPLLPLPGLVVPTDGRAQTGFLSPNIRISESNGIEIGASYYTRIAPNKDLTLTGNFFSSAPPMASARYRHLTDSGAYQITGYGTYSRQSSDATGLTSGTNNLRGYFFGNGRYQFNRHWSLTGSIRRASDRTFLRRYDISREDRLRSTLNFERIDASSYFSLAGWATQTLQLTANQGLIPLALPVMDYRRRFADIAGSGSTLELNANSLALFRRAGQDTQRAFLSAKWDMKRVLPMGQIIKLTTLARADLYHSSDVTATATQIYQGKSGWQSRAIGVAALDLEWPLAGKAFGGTQIFNPRVQLAASPPLRNLAVPNEDARALDLEDSNLFALNRFPGFDRVEDSVRVNYGFDWELQRSGMRVRSTIGQSYRMERDPGVLISGSGLDERLSDIVGRTEFRFHDSLKFTHRFRLDKDNLGIRRNEFDASLGSKSNYMEVGYLRLNRNIATGIEDLRDREELRLATRVAFAKYWSVFGSSVFNLTNNEEVPSQHSDGFQPIRTRLGAAYRDDCIELGVSWRRDFVNTGDAKRGNTFNIYLNIRNLGV